MYAKKTVFFILVALTLSACKQKGKAPEQAQLTKAVDYERLRAGTKPTFIASKSPTNASPTLNPKHGEPGHRCDLAVGAPLNLATNAVSTSKPTGTVTEQVKAPVITAKGMNPPHGQPNHRCDIAVGAPLNSKPLKATATQAAKTESVATVDAKGQRLNPPHGQPNHRCDIAVGAPLNSKTTQNAPTVVAPAQPANTPTTTTATVNASGQKLNPPHGEPNHRCDIAVGAPLT